MASYKMPPEIAQALAALDAVGNGRGKYNINIPDYQAILDKHKHTAPKAINFNDMPVYTGGKQAASKKSNSDLSVNFWDLLSGTLGQLGGAVSNSQYNMVKDLSNPKKGIGEKIFDALLKDSVGGSLVQGAKNGVKQEWNNWHDGKLSWGDIPAVGFLNGMDKGWKRGSDVLGELGVQNKWGKIGGGIALDIVDDPLTYFTGGLSAAGKAGKIAEAAKMLDLGKEIGLTGKFKNADDFVNAATDMFKSKLTQKMPNVSESVIDKTVAKKVGDIAEQIKTARNTAYNAHVNDWGLALPFTNKYVKLGEYGAKNILHRSEATVPQQLVDDLLKQASFGKDTEQLLQEAVKARYGVDHTGQLSKTMFDDLHDFLKPIIDQQASIKGMPEVTTVDKMVTKAMDSESFKRIMTDLNNEAIPWKQAQKQFQDIIDTTKDLDPVHRKYYATMLAQTVKNSWTKATPAKAKAMQWFTDKIQELSHSYRTVEKDVTGIHPHGTPEQLAAKDSRTFTKQFNKMLDTTYNEAGDFKTNMEHFMDKHNIFNPRTLTSKSKFVNSMADHIADANTQRVGETARYSRSMDKVKSFLDKNAKKGIIDNETLMKHAIYILENHAPDAIGGTKHFLANVSDEAKQLANLIRPVIDRLGTEEQKAGILDQLRANYFPHVVNKDPETMAAMEEFAKRHPELNGMKSTSKFNNERKSFQTLAERDNYIEKLEKAIQKATDPAEKEALQAQQERVAKMFDTDVVSALQRRIKEGVRAKAMKEMQTTLSKYGMMKSYPKGEEKDVAGLTKLDADEAKKLGLNTKQTHYIHPEVLKGMKKVDEIFTSEGMNKFVRHATALADVWRPLVTYYKPSHYLNNMIGNVINNMAAGVKVSDYMLAGKLIMGYRKGKLTDAQMKIIEAAYKHNVISGGFLYDAQHTFSHDIPTKLEKFAEKIANNKAIKSVRHKAGEYPDDISRMANFINGMNKTGRSDLAAKQVQKYLFNYNEMTNADRTMRVVVPFWNWTKRNVPLQMKTLLENPKFAMNNKRFMDLFNQDQDGADWQKQTGIHVPQGVANALGANGQQYYTGFQTPVLDLNQVLNPSEMLGSMTPIAKMPIEMAMNKKFYTGKPISYGSDTLMPQDIPSYLASNLGIGGNMFDAMSGRKSIPESLINFLHSISKVNSKNPNGGQ